MYMDAEKPKWLERRFYFCLYFIFIFYLYIDKLNMPGTILWHQGWLTLNSMYLPIELYYPPQAASVGHDPLPILLLVNCSFHSLICVLDPGSQTQSTRPSC